MHEFPLNPAGRRVKQFAQEAGIGVSSIYQLPPRMQPRSVRIGAARIFTESPADWLARVGKAQGGEAA